MIASASLKPIFIKSARVRIRGIPRLDCLGLIEAMSLRAHRFRVRWIPRLDCLGLIEADTNENLWRQCRLSSDSEA